MTRNQRPARRVLCLEILEDRCLLSAGVLDSTFGSGGIVTTPVGLAAFTDEAAYAVALQPDGKLIAAGEAGTATSGSDRYKVEFAVVRYNTNGTLDNSFSSDGKTTTAFGSSKTNSSYARDVEVQTDGKIVVAGSTNGDFAVARYNTDGALDTSFAGTGKMTMTFSKNSEDSASAMELQEDHKIVVAGITRAQNASTSYLALARFNLDGSLDTTFSGDGKATTSFITGLPEMAIYAGTSLQQAGKIVVVAQSPFSSGEVIVARYNPTGNLDPSFGGGAGYVTVASLNTIALGAAVAIQADDRIVVSLTGSTADGSDVYLARLQSDGSLDPAFDSDGIAQASFPDQQEAASVAIQADGKIVVAGYYKGSRSFALRVNSNGSVDTTFGANGIVIVPGVPITSNRVDVAIQSDGKLVLAGGNGDFALARLLGDEPPAALQAASVPERAVGQMLSRHQVEPLFTEAIARWQAAGVDVSSLHGIDVRIANLGGTTLGLASGHTIWLDDNAAGWGWFVDPTPADDREFTTPGNQGEQGRMDLLTVLLHETGHRLGFEHSADGVMAEALAPGSRRVPSSSANAAALDQVFADGNISFAAEPFHQVLRSGQKQREGKVKS